MTPQADVIDVHLQYPNSDAWSAHVRAGLLCCISAQMLALGCLFDMMQPKINQQLTFTMDN